MSEGSVMGKKFKDLYKLMCQDEWNPYVTGIIVAFFSVLILAWMRPWGAVGAIRNWGDWIIYGLGMNPFEMFEDGEAPRHFLKASGSIIGVGFIAGAFLSANLGNQFALRIPPFREMAKAVIAGILMGVGAALAGGCNVGGFYNAIGNLSAHGFAMMLGLVLGAIAGLKSLYWEMENVTWGSGGAKTIELPFALQVILGLLALSGLLCGAYNYAASESDYLAKMGGILLISAALGYAMQRGRWCMIQGFREPHMTGDCTLAKSVALSILLLAIGITVVKAAGLQDAAHYVRGTFGWGGVVGGFVFGLGAMFAGGCGTGTLWRVGEGQLKLWLVVPFFGVSNSLMTAWFRASDVEGMEDWMEEGITNSGQLGEFVYMPDTFLGYGGTLILITLAMAAWYLVVKWNEDSNKLIVPM
jgi:uncharacterized membrane protein YedE/YeeE